MRQLPLFRIATDLESEERLDPVVGAAKRVYSRVFASRALSDVLRGVPVGHSIHPALVQLPLGAFASAAILDLVPSTARPAKILVGVGVFSAIPAIAAGWVDWLRMRAPLQRVGIVHAIANATGVVLYAASFVQRARGHQASGRRLGFAGLTALSVGGYLGGHLAHGQVSADDDTPIDTGHGAHLRAAPAPAS